MKLQRRLVAPHARARASGQHETVEGARSAVWFMFVGRWARVQVAADDRPSVTSCLPPCFSMSRVPAITISCESALHVVDRERRDRRARQRLHLHARAVIDRDGAADDRLVAVHVDLDPAILDPERMAERDQLMRALRGHDTRDNRRVEYGPLRRREAAGAGDAAASRGNRTRASATAVRRVTGLPVTSTMVGRACSST